MVNFLFCHVYTCVHYTHPFKNFLYVLSISTNEEHFLLSSHLPPLVTSSAGNHVESKENGMPTLKVSLLFLV